MANLTFDFLHNYVTGERRASDPADAYQYDEGHVLEAVVPVAVTSCEIQYWIRGMEKADAYTPTSITQNTDNTYTILGNIPNSYFETNGDLRVYIVVTDGDASITTYEGYIHIKERQMPEDYVDDDPDNDAVQIIAAARGYAETSEAWAVGQINGEDVPSTADQYQNNASYYAGQAASAASSAAAQASLAPAYDNTATYAVGDYCLHDGRLYECTTAIATAEAWTAAHWTAVTVGGELSTLKDDLFNTFVTDTATGAIASFPDGADDVPVKSLTVDIEPVQSGSGDPSPSNVRPISGHTQAVVTRTGKNLLDMGKMINSDGRPVGTLNDDGSLTVSTGAGLTASVQQILTGKLRTGTCTVTNLTENYAVYIQIGSNSDYSRVVAKNGGMRTFDYDGNSYLRILFTNQSSNITEIYKAQVEVGSTATVYEPYTADTYTIDLNGTVYGGTLDVTTGVLTVDRAMVDLGTLTWEHNGSGQFYTSETFKNAKTDVTGHTIISSKYKSGNAYVNVPNDVICMTGSTSGRIFIKDTDYSSASTFKESLNGETAVYDLVTPTTIQLTAQEVRTLLGQNNVFADCGDTTVEYRADTKLYIQKVISG